MSKDLMVSMLKQANNGNDLLSILDTLSGENQPTEYKEPTLDSIEF